MDRTPRDSDRIHRQFRDIPADLKTDLDQAFMLSKTGWYGAFDWNELLKSRRVLIVSEAGAGKTFECRAQQRILWDAGEPAFYLDLSVLAGSKLTDMLAIEEEGRFAAWLVSQSDTATFFLDSIDELKLSLGSFEQALKRLAKAINGQLGRARIVVTTRPIPIDEHLFHQLLPVPAKAEPEMDAEAFADAAMRRDRKKKKDDAPPVWRSVALMPLSDTQIREMAVVERITDPDKLLDDIRRRNAEEYARRPQDLIELCADWRDHRAIRTHREQVEHNIVVKLKARTDRNEKAQLPPDKAMEGASRLALAALLTRKLTIRHNAEADRGETSEAGLDPEAILHDWTPAERETLLERALFGFASYGRVRFHHRSVIEYLAAIQLKTLIGRGTPMKAIKRLLFAETDQGGKIVRPSMRPVAGWLALAYDSIFEEIRDREPSVLLNFGDPESLRPAQRSSALQAYVDRYGKGGWRGLQAPSIQIFRFASNGLAPDIRRLWDGGIENPEVRELLLDLIAAAKIDACSDIAFDTAMRLEIDFSERVSAIDALMALNDPRLDAITLSIRDDGKLWPDTLARNVLLRLFPNHIDVDRLGVILGRIKETKHATDEIKWHLPRIIAGTELPASLIDELRQTLTQLVTDGIAWQEHWPHIESKRPYLVGALAATCVGQFKQTAATPDLMHSSVVAIRLAERDGERDGPVADLRKLFADSPSETRRLVFWAHDAFENDLNPQADVIHRYIEAVMRGPIHLSVEQDEVWIHRALSDGSRPLPERALMLEAAMRLSNNVDQWRDHVIGLRRHVQDSPDLLATINDRLKPAKVDQSLKRMEKDAVKRRKQTERREAKAHASWVMFWKEIAEKPNDAFKPERSGNTAWNLWQVMQRSGEESRESGWNRRFIEQTFGKVVADHLRSTLTAIWRGDSPTLRSERAPESKNTYLTRWQLGLAAIAAEAEDPQWAQKLSIEEARLAARYAPIELNGFPSWLGSLVQAAPSAVDDILGAELTLELEESTTQSTPSIVLQNIRYASSPVTVFFLPRLRTWLDETVGRVGQAECSAGLTDHVRQVVDILLKHGDASTVNHVRSMSIAQLETGIGHSLAPVWLPVVMRLNPRAGTERLEHALEKQTPAADSPAVGWIGSLFGNHRGETLVDLSQDQFTPDLLLRLVRLAYRHVRRIDDTEHEGSYSPGKRDHAEHGRGVLLNALLNAKGDAAWAAKLEMANDPLLIHFRDRAIAIARERSAEQIDEIAFDDGAVVVLNKYGEAPPATRSEMFAVMVDRLDDIDDLLLQDISPRATWAGIGDEAIMRREIARVLRDSSNHAYTIDQEAVTADDKETDIRFRSSGSSQQAVIELKIGEKDRSATELRTALKEQLVAKYMAADEVRSGCFLVTVNGDRAWQHPETKKGMGLEDLICMLNEECARIMLDMGGGLHLVARGLDLRPRLPVEKKKVQKV